MREQGVLTGTDGPHHNVIKIRGPMPLSRDDAERVVTVLDVAIREIR
jgi:4-aminobutyrate aminotransferase-like enzyme